MFDNFPNIDTTAVNEQINVPLLFKVDNPLSAMDSVKAHFPTLKFYTIKDNPIVYQQFNRHDGTAHPFTLYSQSWLTLLLLFQFFVYTYVFIRYRKFWTENIKGLFQIKERISFFADSSLKDSNQTMYLSAFTFINLSVFLYLFIAKYYHCSPTNATTILLFFIIISIFFILKYVITKFVGYVFFAWQNELELYKNSLFTIVSLLGILLYINNLFLLYSSFDNLIFFFILGIILLLAFIFLKSFLLLKYFYTRYYSFFYFILYLCTLEILPIAVLYQLLVEIERTNSLTEWIIKL